MVLPAHPLAFPHVVPEVLQLILGVHIRRQYGLVQVLEEVSADHRVPEVQRLPEGLRLCGKGDVALVVVGVKAEGQLLKGGKVLLEAVGIFAQQAAVLLVSALQEFDVGLVKSLGHQLQQSFPLEAPAVEGAEGVIGHLVVPAVFKQVKGGLQLCLRLAVPGVRQSQGIGRHSVAPLSQLRHPAGDVQGGLFLCHSSSLSQHRKTGAGRSARPPCGCCERTTAPDYCSNCSTPFVGADFESLASPQAAKLALSVAPPLPTEPASLGFGGAPRAPGRGSTGGFGSVQMLSQHQSLLEQLQHALGHLVGLGQHGLGGLDQDVVLGVGHHLVGHVGVADGGLGILDVLLHDGQVVDGVVQAVLGGAQSTADIRDIVDGALDLVQSLGSAVLIA